MVKTDRHVRISNAPAHCIASTSRQQWDMILELFHLRVAMALKMLPVHAVKSFYCHDCARDCEIDCRVKSQPG